MTNPISARQTWAESHFLQITIITSSLDMLDEKKNEDVSWYLRHGVINLFQMMNPFNQTDNDRLYNIATGKAACLYTEEVLLTMNVSKCI